MPTVTISDLDESELGVLTRKASAAGVSVQEYLRQLIVRDVARPVPPNELAELVRARSTRTP
jgi:hypothetical protein